MNFEFSLVFSRAFCRTACHPVLKTENENAITITNIFRVNCEIRVFYFPFEHTTLHFNRFVCTN